MKFWAILRFELAYQMRRVWPWLMFGVLLWLSYVLARDHSLSDALYEEFFANSPFAIAKTTVIGTLFWLLGAAVVAGEAGTRDVATGMYPFTYTAPISKAEYLGGRFLAALALNAVLLLAVQLGILLGVYSPGAQLMGPFRPAAFLTAYAFISLPNAFVATALQFSLATRSGRAMTGYFGSVLLVFLGFFVATLVRFFIQRDLGTLLDPIGINLIVEDVAHAWTTYEKSWRLLALEGTVLANRLLWVSVGLSVLAITYLRFRFAHRTEPASWSRRLRLRIADFGLGSAASALGTVPPDQSAIRNPQSAIQLFGFATHARKTLAIAWDSFRALTKSWGGLVLLVFIPLMTVLIVLDQTATLGTRLIPTTARVIEELTGPLSLAVAAAPPRWVIVPLFIVFFAGELVWRERDAGVAEITDATPGSEWLPFLGKFLGLGLLLTLFLALLMAAGMLSQVSRGYHDVEIGLYLKTLFGLQLPEYLLFAVVALTVHVVVNHKYVAHLVAIIAYSFIAAFGALLGIEHNLLIYGAGPWWSYTEMRGFGGSVGPWLAFKFYWAAWALLLAVGARMLWVRGKESGIGMRLQLARRRFTRPTAWVAGAAALLIVSVGGFVFYNTNVLNEYRTSSRVAEHRAEYERRYRRFETIPQPQMTGTRLHIEIYPARRAAQIRGSYRLVNTSASGVDSIHVATPTGGVETRAMTLDRKATLVLDDAEYGHRIYALERPLRRGDSLRLDFEVRVERRGFGNRGADRSLAARGSYFTNQTWFPSVGYQRYRELLPPAERRAHGLEPRPLLAALADIDAGGSALGDPWDRGIEFEAVVGTDEDQVAVAPGALRRTWVENPSLRSGQAPRRYFHYATDGPIGGEWAFFSAQYAVREERWNGVAIRILHYPQHTGHLEGMISSVRASLDYYTRQFAPYRYRHLTVVEHPAAAGVGGHADPSMISHGQGFASWIPKEGDGGFDLPFFVMAHEVAHQWTVSYAFVEGLPFLAEGLATYFAMRVVKETRGDAQFRRLMAFMRQPFPYAPIRRGEPLLRALDPYLSRRKGPFALRALSEYVGPDRVDRAIRRLIETHGGPAAARATTLDLYRELRAVTPDSLKPLLHDLFEVNAFWVLKAERVTAVQRADSTWQVTLDVRARKMVYDSAGVETEVPMNEWVEIGVFARPDSGGSAYELNAPLYLQRHRIPSGRHTITVTVPRRPVLAGIDPFHVLDWEEKEEDDNIEGPRQP